MASTDRAILTILAAADEPLTARVVAAQLHGMTEREAIDSGQSAHAARQMCSLSAKARGLTMRHYPTTERRQHIAYAIMPAGRAALDQVAAGRMMISM